MQAILSIARLSAWLMLLAAIFTPLERFFAAHEGRRDRKQVGVDLGYFFLSGLLPAALMSLPIALLAWAARHLVPGEFLATMAGLPLGARLVLGLVAGEVGYYWGHRWSHEIPFLWRFHAIHHSAEHVDYLVNTRAHPVDLVFGRLCALVPIYLIGLGGPVRDGGSFVPVAVTLIGTVWGFFIHANLRWRFGPLEWLVSTPAFHHWHHTLSGPVDRNYASTFPWLDRIFGTHHLPDAYPDDYGIRAKLPEALTDQLLHPLRSPRRRRARPAIPAVAAPPVEAIEPGGSTP